MKVAYVAVALTGAMAGAAMAQSPAESPVVSAVTVTIPTPLAGSDPKFRGGSAPSQTVASEAIARSHAADLTAFMTRSMNGVYVNEVQGNPLQPDVNYRGSTASPLLGASQGLSVYLDGVRLNQPFGDVVSWDLIPRAAIDSITLEAGSNPLFGLNSLGGAVSIRTKNGKTAPGSSLQLGYGSNRRAQGEFETGGSLDNGLNWYLTGNQFKEDGWRDASPSKAAQLFGKAGWSGGGGDVSVSLAFADTDLTGNGLQDQRFLLREYASIYTKPDNTRNRSGLVDLAFAHRFGGGLSFTGNAHYRAIRTRTLNGDINEGALGENLLQPSAAERRALASAGYAGFPQSGETAANTPFPSWRCIANVLLNAEPNEKCDGLLNRTATDQSDAGAAGQLDWRGQWAGAPSSLTIGAAFLSSRVRFAQSSQFAYLTSDRGVVPVPGAGAFADGSQDSENAFDARVQLSGRAQTWSAYAAGSVSPLPNLTITASGRFDDTRVHDRDKLDPGGGTGSLDGDHEFRRFNPALGLTLSPARSVGAYLGASQSSRAPSAIELGCADPANPCRLPNAMAGDPPLAQVLTQTLEAGLRSPAGARIVWSLGLFRADNRKDILFVADDQAGFGYFKNFGRTRRQGVEAAASGRLGAVDLSASYTYLEATYQSAETVTGEANSSNDGPGPGFGGDIAIRPGDHIPLIPRQLFKAAARWDVSHRLSLDADMIAVGGVYARGDENNQHHPDGVYTLGPGATKAYSVLNIGGDYRPSDHLKLFVQINNLLDRKYSTAAQLGATGFSDTGAFVARPFAGPAVDGELPSRGVTFLAPGAPRSIWLGLRYQFGGAS